jgi:hypothetical protein
MQRREPGTRVQSIPSLEEVYFNKNLPCFGDLEGEDRNATRFFMTSG